jgi:hypothetical protein
MSRDQCHEPFARESASWLRRQCLFSRFPPEIICSALLLFTLAQVSGCATVRQQPPIAVVQSRVSGANPSLARFFVTVHVLLQVHENPDEAIRATEDKARILACQERIVANALRLGKSGVRAIVAEGIYGVGSLAKPVPVQGSQFTQPNKLRAAEILAANSDLAVYGFELKPLNEFGMVILQQLGSSAARAREIGKDGSGISKPENDEEFTRLIQDDSTRLNLWHAGLVPERSFLALQTALTIALARHENQIQLIIGRAHWNDLVYAIDRHPDVRLRLVPYPCE